GAFGRPTFTAAADPCQTGEDVDHCRAPAAMRSAVTLGSAPSTMLRLGGIRQPSGLHLDCGKSFNPRPQVVREHKCPPTALDRSQLSRLDRLIKGRPPTAGDIASL